MDNLNFTVNVVDFIRTLINDPSVKEEVDEALKLGPMEPDTPCGYANSGTQEKPIWMSLFVATNQAVESGSEGYVYRTANKKRISCRLRKQQPRKSQPMTEKMPAATAESMKILQKALQDPAVAKAVLEQLGATKNAPDNQPTADVYEEDFAD